MPLLLLAFIAIPLLEIAVFIQVGGWLGLWPTLAIVVATAIFGTYMLRRQGLATLMRVQQQLDRNELPLREVFDGLCLLVAGALLLTPGFVTDAAGALLFVPAVRAGLRGYFGRWLLRRGEMHVQRRGPAGGPPGQVIDVEFEDLTPPSRPGDPDPPARR